MDGLDAFIEVKELGLSVKAHEAQLDPPLTESPGQIYVYIVSGAKFPVYPPWLGRNPSPGINIVVLERPGLIVHFC